MSGWSRVLVLLLALISVAGCGADRASGPRSQWVGFNDISLGYRLAAPELDAALSERAGASIARVTLDWRQIEPAPGRFDWAAQDRLHAALRARGIRPLPVVVFAPSWTWQAGVTCPHAPWCSFPPSPANDRAWERFVTAAAQRYRDAVAIEVWNEPNLHGFWAPRPDPARYARLLQLAVRAVRSHTSLPVLVGGVGSGPPGTDDTAADQFLRAVGAAAGAGAYDGVGVHLYPGPAGSSGVAALLDPVRRVAGKPLWVTEVGYSTAGPPATAAAREQAQAAALASTYGELRGMRDVAAVVFHTLIDRPGDPLDPETGYGIVHSDLRPKPAFCVLGTALRSGSAPPGCPR